MTPEDLPKVFAHGWALPKPEPFLDYFLPRVAPDAVFTQPIFPRAIGHQQIAHTFWQLFALVPNLTAVPVRTAIDHNTVFIESTCTGTLARRRVQFMVCDRFEVREGRIVERHSYSDPLPLLVRCCVIRPPGHWCSRLADESRPLGRFCGWLIDPGTRRWCSHRLCHVSNTGSCSPDVLSASG